MAVVQYKTPGVYVEELDAFPPSIVGVETAVPVFIGYTERAERNGRSVHLQPVRIGSMVDYRAIFGGPFEPAFRVFDDVTPAEAAAKTAKEDLEKAEKDAKEKNTKPEDAKKILDPLRAVKTDADDKLRKARAQADVTVGDKTLRLDRGSIQHFLFNGLRLFYANGGGNCFIVSVGGYGDEIQKEDFDNGLAAVRDLVGPTMLVVPEAVLLTRDNYNTLTADMLKQCQDKQDRVAILDIWAPPDFTEGNLADVVKKFREGLSAVPSGALKYGMAYAPFLRTSIVDPSELDYTNFAEFTEGKPGLLTGALLVEANRLFPDPPPPPKQLTGTVVKEGTVADAKEGEKPVTPAAEGGEKAADKPAAAPTWLPAGSPKVTTKTNEIGERYFAEMKETRGAGGEVVDRVKAEKINQGLTASIPALKEVYAAMAAKLGILPPSAAMAGIYTQNDTLRGVWNAPANVGLNAVVGPMLKFSTDMQKDLNMPIDGFAINAIREFPGRGTLVWGARTLDGNSNDWRYIQVRRALIYIEQSVELALNKFVFEPNVARTWVTVASMVGSFLRGVWQAGGLMGASPAEAFSVQCGLGSTMTAQDVLEGRMLVQIKLQMVRPAEFIVLTFQQQMQGGAG